MSWGSIKLYQRNAYGAINEAGQPGFDESLLYKWINKHEIYTCNWDVKNDYLISLIYNKFLKKKTDKCLIELPPYIDHVSVFKSHRDKLWIVFHPYNNTVKDKNSIVEWGKKLNLNVEISDIGNSWYNPDTLLVTITNF